MWPIVGSVHCWLLTRFLVPPNENVPGLTPGRNVNTLPSPSSFCLLGNIFTCCIFAACPFLQHAPGHLEVVADSNRRLGPTSVHCKELGSGGLPKRTNKESASGNVPEFGLTIADESMLSRLAALADRLLRATW